MVSEGVGFQANCRGFVEVLLSLQRKENYLLRQVSCPFILIGFLSVFGGVKSVRIEMIKCRFLFDLIRH